MCVKSNIQFNGTGPFCMTELASGQEKQLFVLSGPYTYNHDGTLCENLTAVGGVFNGQQFTFHDYVSPKGDLIFLIGANIDYACPGVPSRPVALSAGPANLF